jgi:hypothetical protein
MPDDDALPTDPAGVWALIVRSDELVKYAGNRDPATAYAQARETLARARNAAAALEDRSTGADFERQIQTRLDDIEGAEREG